MLRFWIKILLFVGWLAFCVYIFNVRLDYRFDRQEKYIGQLEYQVSALSYGMELIPKEIKNDIFITSVKKNFSDIKKYPVVFKALTGVIVEDPNEPIVWKPISLMNSYCDGVAAREGTEKYFVYDEEGNK